MRKIIIGLVASAFVLTGCGDGEPPELGDLPSVSPTRSLNPSDLPSRPSATTSVGPSQSAEPTESEPEPTKSEAEPTKSEAEPTKSETEPTKSEAEPTKSEAEPTKSETEPTPTDPSATPSPTDSTEPAAQPSESTPGWLWLLLLGLALAGAAIWWLMGRRQRTAAWYSEFEAAATEAGWLVDQPVSAVVEAPSGEAMNQAWSEASSTISDVDQQLYRLRDAVPNAAAQQRLDATRTALDELRVDLLSLVEEIRAGAGVDEQRQQTVRVEQSRTALRQVIAKADRTTS